MAEWLIRYWLQVAFGSVISLFAFLFRVMWKKQQENKIEQTNLRYGVLALLRNSLISDYNEYMRKGYVPIYAMDSIDTMYQAYRDLSDSANGGAVSKLYQELKELPTKDPREDFKHE